MTDLNFFESYIDKKHFKFSLMMVLYVFIIFYILYTVFTGIFNQYQINTLKNDVASLQAIAENPTTLEKIRQIKEKESEVNTFKEEVNKIKEMDRVVASEDIIDEDFLNLVTSKMPDDLFFTNLSINNREIQISGISKDKWAVAEFNKGLSGIDIVDEIFVSNITAQEDYYRFMLMITLKEVSIYAEDTI